MSKQHRTHVVAVVLNRVEGDSRVIKTARVALEAGYDATIVGVGSSKTAETLEIEGVRVIRVPNYSKCLAQMGLWPNPEGIRHLDLLLDGVGRTMLDTLDVESIDILHSHDMFGLKLGSMIAEEISTGGRRVPWVHDLHEYVAGLESNVGTDYRAAALRYERRYLHKPDVLMTVSEPLARTVAERYNLAADPSVVLNAPFRSQENNGKSEVRSALGLADDIPLVAFVGVANDLRGCRTMVKALKQLDQYHLVFVSQNAYAKELKREADAGPAAGRFHLHPYVPTDQVSAFVRTADIGIHGLVHYPNGEVALPNKLFEYLHASLPIVASDVAAMKGFVEKHDIGEIYEADNVESCANAVRRAFERRQIIKANITDELKMEYSWEHQSRKLLSIYRELEANDISLLSAAEREEAIKLRDRTNAEADVRLSRAASEINGALLKGNSSEIRQAVTQLKQVSENKNVSGHVAPGSPHRVRRLLGRVRRRLQRGLR
ncbi:MAG: glycosyltransferase family 4 protein [Parvularcula sp.]|nr:glycosyltransferase family 4 protein [Parvularcula sp.]